RKLGEQRVPDGVILERPEDAIAVLGKEEDAESFLLAAREITAAFPKLEAWVHRKPLKVIEHCGEWTRVLSVLRFVCDHPRPQLFCRQLELPGVDTKFIEGRQRLLAELFDCLLPPDAIEESAPLRREAWFEHRYGFLYDPPRIRFRLLDPALREQTPFEDCSVPLSGLARHPIASRVFIVENQISGLAFPDVPGSAVIFGLGYGVGMLRGVDWLRQIPVHYWGDLDTHGFAILARVRSFLPQARSLLMDRETLFAYRDRWGEETKRASLDDTAAACLTVDEQRALAALDPGAGQSGLRLEQEQIPISAVRRALNHLGLFDVSGPAV
ncbi:MAG: Wadjet anti-phage system protein JetD domain-containing protein, partial [Myxococcota bacterium]